MDPKTLEEVLTQIGQQLVRGGLPQTIEVGQAGWQAFAGTAEVRPAGLQGLRLRELRLPGLLRLLQQQLEQHLRGDLPLLLQRPLPLVAIRAAFLPLPSAQLQ